VFGWRDANTLYSDVGGGALGWLCGEDLFSNDGRALCFVALAFRESTPSCPGTYLNELAMDFELAWGGDLEDLIITT
jgi:hypothetical protein